ncbi:hypothetical protein BJM39_02280 [Salmonella enterica subsp. enterica serovar Javiana]|nr:hypothetical protein BJM39_02280 [Salmonella enterica subsp. enterica serovar Javiana]
MAIQQRMPVQFDDVFPEGALMRGEVSPVEDFDLIRAAKAEGREPGDVQVRDKVTGQRVWEVRVVDLDEEAAKGQGEVTVKVTADVQPVPPPREDGQKLRPVAFDNMTLTAWIDDRGNRPKIGWSLRASSMRAPGAKAAPSRPTQAPTADKSAA